MENYSNILKISGKFKNIFGNLWNIEKKFNFGNFKNSGSFWKGSLPLGKFCKLYSGYNSRNIWENRKIYIFEIKQFEN